MTSDLETRRRLAESIQAKARQLASRITWQDDRRVQLTRFTNLDRLVPTVPLYVQLTKSLQVTYHLLRGGDIVAPSVAGYTDVDYDRLSQTLMEGMSDALDRILSPRH